MLYLQHLLLYLKKQFRHKYLEEGSILIHKGSGKTVKGVDSRVSLLLRKLSMGTKATIRGRPFFPFVELINLDLSR